MRKKRTLESQFKGSLESSAVTAGLPSGCPGSHREIPTAAVPTSGKDLFGTGRPSGKPLCRKRVRNPSERCPAGKDGRTSGRSHPSVRNPFARSRSSAHSRLFEPHHRRNCGTVQRHASCWRPWPNRSFHAGSGTCTMQLSRLNPERPLQRAAGPQKRNWHWAGPKRRKPARRVLRRISRARNGHAIHRACRSSAV